jgi:hypothetical protein
MIARQGNRIEVAVAMFAGFLRNNGRVLLDIAPP